MVDSDERFPPGQGEGLRGGDADEEGGDEAGALRDRDGVDIVLSESGRVEGFSDDGDDVPYVLARGEVRDDAAVLRVEFDLRGDDA